MMKMMDTASAAQQMNPVVNRAPDREPRQIERFLEADVGQLGAFAHLMRRAEEIADRVAGAVPAVSGNTSETPYGPGLIGDLQRLHDDRASIGSRLGEALDRIERVL